MAIHIIPLLFIRLPPDLYHNYPISTVDRSKFSPLTIQQFSASWSRLALIELSSLYNFRSSSMLQLSYNKTEMLYDLLLTIIDITLRNEKNKTISEITR